MSTDPKRVKDVFLEAAELPDEAARAAFLDRACGGDAGLRGRVEALLRSHDPGGSFLGTPAAVAPDPDHAGTVAYLAPERKAASTSPAAEALAFLAPPGRPGSLGRIGHYEVLQVLGHGGFGIVFRALDVILERVVAVKVMAPQIATTSPARKRFLREARSSASVRHENVVQVYEVAEQPLPYLVMEFIPGETLQQRLDRCGPVDVAETLRIGRQIAAGLAAAHDHDLIHRDIKPANVLLESGPHGHAKITDFGLARAADDASISQSGIIAGTPMYMAPEQAQGETLDQRADLFSLGSVLYQMATGRPPFRANTTVAVLKRVAEDQPRDIREITPETPKWLCDIIAKLHAKNPDDRFQSAREVADLLADCEAKLKAKQEVKRVFPASPDAGKPAGRKWAAAAVLLLPMIALAATEFAGVTHLFRGRPATTDPLQPGSGPTPVAVAKTEPPVPVARKEPPPVAIAPFDADRAGAHQEAWAKHLGVPVEFKNQLGMTFRLIPPGEFLMGIDAKDVDATRWKAPDGWPANFLGDLWPQAVAGASPKHPVKLTRAFYMQTHEVRHGWYKKMLGDNPEFDPTADPDSPVRQFASWKDAVAFCNALSKHEGKRPCYAANGDDVTLTPDGDGYRLPTEAEWEFACRAGTSTPWFFGDSPLEPDKFVFRQYQTAKTKTPKPNPFGLIDMYGGSTEWVWDGHEPYRSEAVADPVLMPGRKDRICRGSTDYDHDGGAFWTANSFYRQVVNNSGNRSGHTGFGRVAISIPASAPGEHSPFRIAGDRVPFTDADVERITALPAARQVEVVREELKKRNPGFDGKLTPTINNNVVTGLQFLTDELDDIAPVRALKGLTELGCRGSSISKGRLSDLSPLQGMSLTSLDLGFTQVRDLTPLKGMNLHALQAQAIPASDLTPLQGMPLKSLDLHRSGGITNLKPLQGMPLEYLNLSHLAVPDLSPLKDVKSLKLLALHDMAQLSDLKPLEGLRLDELDILRTGVTDLTPLKGMELKQVVLPPVRNIAEGLDILRAMKSLKTIGITHDRIWPAAEFWERYDKGEFTQGMSPDRKAAEYVLTLGGTIKVDGKDEEVRAAADLPKVPFRLTGVSLRDNKQVTDAGLAAFKDCTNLTHLGLDNTPVTDAALVNFKGCKNLSELSLAFTAVGDAGLAHLKDWSVLTSADIRFTQVTDTGLANFKECKKLTYLNLTACEKVTDAGLVHLKDCQELQSISLDGTRATDAGLAHLKACGNLREMQLPTLPITDAGLEHLAGLDKLTELNLNKTQVTAKGVEKLAKALPKCKITWDGGTLEPK